MNPVRSDPRRAVTLLEVILVVAILVIVAGMIIPAGSRPTGRSRRLECVNHLRTIGVGLRTFAGDHGGAFPMSVPTNEGGTRELTGDASLLWEQFRTLSNHLNTPKILWCPSDVRRTPALAFTPGLASGRERMFSGNQSLSYFLNLNASEERPGTILGGDRNLTNENGGLSPGRWALSSGTRLGFDGTIHEDGGNLLLGDGSARRVTPYELRNQFHASLSQSGTATNVWIVP